MTSINTREDLDVIVGTPEHAAFIHALQGSIYRLEKDDAAQAWVAMQDTRTIQHFGFTLADFPGAVAPALPEYIAPSIAGGDPEGPTVDDLQIRLALNEFGLRDAVEAAVAQSDQSVKDWWAKARNFKRHNVMVIAVGAALGKTDAELDSLWALAATK